MKVMQDTDSGKLRNDFWLSILNRCMENRFSLIIIAIALLAGVSRNAVAGTIPVGKGKMFSSIKAAVASAQPGDTIVVDPGEYREGNILVRKALTFLGRNFPVLSGENKYEIFTINATDVTIDGFFFKDTGVASIEDIAAIKVLDSKRIRIRNNRFKDTFFGIYFANSSYSWVENNSLTAVAEAEHQIGNGIHMWKCDRVTIQNNDVRGHRDGIYFEFVTNSLIEKNHSEGNLRYGLHFMFSHNDEYRDNTFIHNGAGVAVMYTKGVKMLNNTFEHNWGPSSYGLLLKDIRDSQVTGNKFIKNSVAIFMEGSSRIAFERNKFESNGYAIKLQASCDDNVFAGNNFLSNTFDMVTNSTLVLNEIRDNYWDRYEGYDLNRDQVGDVPYRPVSMYAMVVERMPTAVLLWRSFLVFLVDRSERAIPVLTPENLRDNSPQMKPYDLN
jgi:nitrous oxidase accessory protein